MKNINKGFTTVELLIVLFVLFCIVGQCLTLYRLFKCDFEPSYKAEIIYSVSLITGIGAITGYIDFGK